MLATCIIGIGSPHGADQLGWLLCEQLKKLDWPEALDIQICRTPAQLPELLSHCENAILIDAILTKTGNGEIVSLSVNDLAESPHASHSSHGFGVVEALELAAALGQIPASVIILGIAVNSKTRDISAISPSLLSELQAAIKRSLLVPVKTSHPAANIS